MNTYKEWSEMTESERSYVRCHETYNNCIIVNSKKYYNTY